MMKLSSFLYGMTTSHGVQTNLLCYIILEVKCPLKLSPLNPLPLQATADMAIVEKELRATKGNFTAKALYKSLPLDLYAKIIGLCSSSSHLKDLAIEAPMIGKYPSTMKLHHEIVSATFLVSIDLPWQPTAYLETLISTGKMNCQPFLRSFHMAQPSFY